MRRAALAGLLAVGLLLPLGAGAEAEAAAPRWPVALGIGDQKTDLFGDRRFQALRVRLVRRSVPWNVMRVGWQRRELRAWLVAAKRAGVQPLITFDRARSPSKRKRHTLPTARQYAREFRLLRAWYPWLRTFATWNEVNHDGQPTYRRVGQVVAYYRALRRECPRCTVLAGELLDYPNMVRWVREFRRRLGFEPKFWGLHNYRDTNYLRTANTRALLRGTRRSRIWLTEVGGIVARRNVSRVRFTESVRHAALATRWVIERLLPLSRRLERVYFYHWNSLTRRDSWDSAFVARDGRARPSLGVLQRWRTRQLRLAAARARARAGR